MPAILQAMRSGATELPEEIMNFLASRIVAGIGGVYGKNDDSFLCEEAAVPDMTVKVNQGHAFVRASGDDMVYPIRLYDADDSVTIEANTSGNPRIDTIVLYLNLGTAANSDATNVATLAVVQGTAAASPAAPNDAQIQADIGANPFIRLANVAVANGAVSITDSEITDKRDEVKFNTSTNLPDGFGENYQISTEISSDDLIVYLKDSEGRDLSEQNRAHFNLGGNLIEITENLSLTLDDADGDFFDWDTGKIQGNDAQLFVYAIYNNGSIEFGLSPCPSLKTVETNYYDSGGQTGSIGITNIVMSGTLDTSVGAVIVARVIGRINVQQADDDDWEAPDTEKIINHPIFETDRLNVTASTGEQSYYITGNVLYIDGWDYVAGNDSDNPRLDTVSLCIAYPQNCRAVANYIGAKTVASGTPADPEEFTSAGKRVASAYSQQNDQFNIAIFDTNSIPSSAIYYGYGYHVLGNII